MRNPTIRLLLVPLAALLLGAGCAGGLPEIKPAHGKPTDLTQLDQTHWTADLIEGEPVKGAGKPMLVFERRSRVVGIGGCNRFSGPVSQKGAVITVGRIEVTTKSCSPEIDAQEQRFLAALQTPSRLQRSFDKLYFVAAEGGAVRLRFHVADSPGDHP